jgi:cation diffusion facilitator family transporter
MKQNQLIKNASYASVAAGLVIFVIKCVGWTESDSVSLFASLIDSLLDITSSFLSAIAIQIALSPADDNHRFGHNKVQDLAVFAQAVFFIGSGALTLFVSIKQLHKGHVIHNYESGLISMGLCSAIGFALLAYQAYVIKHTNSQIIKADRIHYLSDCASNVAVIVSIAGSQYFQKLDGIFGILISGYIIFSAIEIMRGAIKNLTDEEFSKEDKEKVLQILKNNKDILGVHDLKTRHAGNKAFIQLHIDLNPSISLIDAHYISEKLSDELLATFPNGEVIIHQDPLGFDDVVEYRENIK